MLLCAAAFAALPAMPKSCHQLAADSGAKVPPFEAKWAALQSQAENGNITDTVKRALVAGKAECLDALEHAFTTCKSFSDNALGASPKTAAELTAVVLGKEVAVKAATSKYQADVARRQSEAMNERALKKDAAQQDAAKQKPAPESASLDDVELIDLLLDPAVQAKSDADFTAAFAQYHKLVEQAKKKAEQTAAELKEMRKEASQEKEAKKREADAAVPVWHKIQKMAVNSTDTLAVLMMKGANAACNKALETATQMVSPQ